MKRHLKKQLLHELTQVPIIEIACQKVGISRQTFYRWRAANASFSQEIEAALNMGRDFINDVSESTILEHIKNGEIRPAIFWLRHNNSRYKNNPKIENMNQLNNNKSLKDMTELAKQNLFKSVEAGNIDDSKFLLESIDPAFYKTGKFIASRKYETEEDRAKKKAEFEFDVQKSIDMMMRFASSRGEEYEEDQTTNEDETKVDSDNTEIQT